MASSLYYLRLIAFLLKLHVSARAFLENKNCLGDRNHQSPIMPHAMGSLAAEACELLSEQATQWQVRYIVSIDGFVTVTPYAVLTMEAASGHVL